MWISYFIVTILANIIAAIVFREHINFTGFSAFPIGYIVFIIGSAFYYPSKLHAKHDMRYKRKYALAFHGMIIEYSPEQQIDYYAYMHDYGLVVVKTLLPYIPFLLMFVLFFHNAVKAISGFYIIFLIYLASVHYATRDIKENNVQRQKELMEQKAKEELGKWK